MNPIMFMWRLSALTCTAFALHYHIWWATLPAAYVLGAELWLRRSFRLKMERPG